MVEHSFYYLQETWIQGRNENVVIDFSSTSYKIDRDDTHLFLIRVFLVVLYGIS